jgi:hypothetical protein
MVMERGLAYYDLEIAASLMVQPQIWDFAFLKKQRCAFNILTYVPRHYKLNKFIPLFSALDDDVSTLLYLYSYLG